MIKSDTPKEIFEILRIVSEAKTEREKVAILQEENCLALRDVLKGAFDDSIQWNLPEGRPEYETGLSVEGKSPTSLRKHTRQFAYMIKGGEGGTMKAYNREKLFLQILEGVHPEDAKVLVAMKDKSLHVLYPGLTKVTVKKAFPKLITK